MELQMLVENMRDEIIEKTQQLVKIKSVKSEPQVNAPFGLGIKQCLDDTLKLCDMLGFKIKNIDGYAGHAEYGEGEEIVGILVHLDVVPEGTGWSCDPYKAVIKDGKLYGRGVNDDKGAAVAAIYALKAIKDIGLKMNKRIRIIFGCDEESGWECMNYYLKHEKMPNCGFSPDGPFPIVNREKGILRVSINKDFKTNSRNQIRIRSLKGGQRPNMVPDYCQCVLTVNNDVVSNIKDLLNNTSIKYGKKIKIEQQSNEFTIKSYGESAHGSEPYHGYNAITQLLMLLKELPNISDDQASYINFLTKYIGIELHGKSLGIDLKDDASGELTLNLGMMNLTEDGASTTLDIRYPVTFKGVDIINKIKDKAFKENIEIVIGEDKEPLYVPTDNPLIPKLSKAYETVLGVKPELISLKGGTYARAIKNAVAFGPILPGKIDTAHQKDEYLEIEDLIISAKIYAQAIYELNK